MPVTIKDVAKIANVSPSTVSRVIANNPKISDATKQIVYKAMEELDYKPNIIARSLANRKTYTLGLILPTKNEEIFENPFFIQAMRGLSTYAQKKDYYIMYSYCMSVEDELKAAETFIHSKWVDGIILMASRIDDPCVQFLRKKEHPFVVIGRPDDYKDESLWVDNDNVGAMYNVVKQLIEQGHKKIGFIGGEQQFTVYRHRLRGYKQALEDFGIMYDEALVVLDEPTEQKAYEGTIEMLSHTIPDAIIGTDDTLAFGAYKALNEKGLDNIAIAGFNNTPMALYKTPSLSSVDINAEKLGEEAAKLLIQHLNNEDTKKHVIVDAEYIERDSTLKFTM